MSINARNKGKAGESEWINRFSPFFPGRELKRNLEQVRSGGSDICGVEPWVVEVKRCEKLEFNKWWRQVNAAVLNPEEMPVVSYRQNRGKWMFLVSTELLGVQDGRYAIIEEDTWIQMVIQGAV